MLTFTIYGKSFKTLVEKAMTVANNKASLSSLQRIYFKIQNGNLHVFATNIEHYIDVVSKDAYGIVDDGEFAMDIEEAKLIAKMTDNITITETTEEGSELRQATIKCGKKQLTVRIYDNTENLKLPELNDTTEYIMSTHEDWLLETVVNLDKFTSDINNEAMKCININTECGRFEALDGYRVTTRKISGIITTKKEKDLLLHKMATNVMKKVLDKKSKLDVAISCDDKYIRVDGIDFTYVQYRIDAQYFNLEQILNGITNDFEFDVDKNNLLEVAKYAKDIIKDTKIPLVFHSENGNVYTYCNTSKYEVFDELETENVRMSENIYIGFNPTFFVESLSIADTDNVHIIGTTSKCPISITSDDYSFVILPVNLGNDEMENKMRNKINKLWSA